MNKAVQLGLEATNNARQNNVTSTAQQKIGFILDERAKIKSYSDAKKVQQEALSKLALEVVTYQDVTGVELPTAPNQNQVTIIKAIEQINASNQKSVEFTSKSHIDGTASYDKSIAACQERIKVLNEELAKLAVDVVTEEQVVG
jgi:hypothetical protein